MSEPIQDAVKNFVEQVFGNDTLTNEEKKLLVWKALKILAGGVTDGELLWGKSMAIGSLAQDAGRKASGFNGNLAKSHYFDQLKEELTDEDSDVGC